MGEDLQRPDDDGGCDRSARPSQHHPGTESSQLPHGGGQEISHDGGEPCSGAMKPIAPNRPPSKERKKEAKKERKRRKGEAYGNCHSHGNRTRWPSASFS